MRGGWSKAMAAAACVGALAAPPRAQAAPGEPAPQPAAPPAASACRMLIPRHGEFDVVLERHRIVLPVQIDGHPVRAILDTGAETSLIMRSAAVRLGLALRSVPGVRMTGAGGETQAMSARVDLAFAGDTLRATNMLVAGEHAMDVDMVLGDDVMSHYDLELDLPHRVVRVLHAEHCADGEMPYWAHSYSAAPLGRSFGAQIVLPVRINGRALRAVLDTGAPTSIATADVAASAGVRLAAGPGELGGGVGARTYQQRSGHVDLFEIGGEQIRNADLTFGDLFRGGEEEETGSRLGHPGQDQPGMLLGYDFLAAHHVLIVGPPTARCTSPSSMARCSPCAPRGRRARSSRRTDLCGCRLTPAAPGRQIGP